METPTPKPKKGCSKTFIVTVGLLGLIALTAIYMPLFSRGGRSPTISNLSRGRQFTLVCRSYSTDHGNRLPVDRKDLIPDYIKTTADFDKMRYQDPQTHVAYDWVRYVDQADPESETITYSSPIPDVERKDISRRIVFHADGSGMIQEESAFIEKLAAQMRVFSAKATPQPASK